MGVVLVLAACAHGPRPLVVFDNQPGGWESAAREQGRSYVVERWGHAVHAEQLEIYEFRQPAPAANAAAFNALAEGPRGLPALPGASASPRAVDDDPIGPATGYWVAQRGHEGATELQAAVYVVPNGRRSFAVRLQSGEDEFGQLQAWLRDLITRNVRFPAPQN